jgi:hypothetical protein
MDSGFRLATKIASRVSMPIPFQHIVLSRDSFLLNYPHKYFDFLRDLYPPHPTISQTYIIFGEMFIYRLDREFPRFGPLLNSYIFILIQENFI